MTKALRIGFMGTPAFAVAALDALNSSRHDVVCVYTQPPRPKGRGHQVQLSPVHEYAVQHQIPVFTPLSLKKEAAQAEFAAHKLDVSIVAAYGLILPKAVLNAPEYGCINIHASLLPRWRGASPIQRSIWAGDMETGITLMQMDEGLDTGPVIMERPVAINDRTTTALLHDTLSLLGADMIAEAMALLADKGVLASVPQNNDLSTYAPLLKKEDGRVEWTQNARAIDRQVRALNPWPGVWTELNGRRMKILEAVPDEMAGSNKTGEILDRAGNIACAEGTVLRIVRVQPENSKPMDFAAAVNGGHIPLGSVFS